jgi:hypothetical protein
MNTFPETVAPLAGAKISSEPGLRWEHILAPVDFTPASIAALKHAAKLAVRDRSSLCLLRVLDQVSESLDQNFFYSVDDMRRQAERKLAQLSRLFVPAAMLEPPMPLPPPWSTTGESLAVTW